MICTNPECVTPFCSGCDYSSGGPENPAWLDDSVQFPRLLAEINALGLTPEQYRELAASMDLDPRDVDQLFDRAERAWQAIKDRAL